MSALTNRAKGAVAELGRLYPTGAIMLFLEAAEADAVLIDYTDLATLLAAAGNTELTTAGYARKTGLAVTVTVDNDLDQTTVSVPQQVFEGIVTGGTINKVILGIATGAGDENIIPLGVMDAFILTDGNPITINFSQGYFFAAS